MLLVASSTAFPRLFVLQKEQEQVLSSQEPLSTESTSPQQKHQSEQLQSQGGH